MISYMIKKTITMTIHTQPRKPGPLSPDERKELTSFFALLMEWNQQENVAKEKTHAKPNQ
jgi:hypothetical protein